MKTYLVGGAVRDSLLGRPVLERDWLVTGVTGSQLEQKGFRRVGKQFPVYLHPVTAEEYALPRGDNEGPAALQEDLKRRDLTINAMALDQSGRLIDPCGGGRDLRDRLLRHTAFFPEDPVRLLRLARFAARYEPLGFGLAPETRALVDRMAAAGEPGQQAPERVLSEIEKALKGEGAGRFFELLREWRILPHVLPELDCLFGVPQPARYHPEIDTGLHSLMALRQACQLSDLPEVRLAALLHDVGKALTPHQEWPRHIGHEQRGVKLIEALAIRMRLPNRWRDLAIDGARYHLHAHRALTLRPKTLLKLIESLDALRRPQRFEQYLQVCEADARGRSGFETTPYPQAGFLREVVRAAAGVDAAAIARHHAGSATLPERVRRARLRAIAACQAGWR